MRARDDAAPLLRRVAPRSGRRVAMRFDGAEIAAYEGESLLAALLAHGARLRRFEFAETDRAGFCLMGACQDCWVWREDGVRLRACSAPVEDGLRLFGEPPPYDAPSYDAPP